PKPPLPGPAPSSTYTDAEWAKIVEAARKEGKLMVYANPSFISWKETAVREGMKEAYGIDVEMIRGPAATMVERLQTETRAGVYVADIFQGFATVTSVLEKLGFLKVIDNLPSLKYVNNPDVWYYNPLLSPSFVAAPATWPAGGGNYNYSTKVVPPERVPVKLQELLDPYWKGKVCMVDPVTSPGQSDYTLWVGGRSLGYQDWFLDFFYDLMNKDAGRIYWFLLGTPNPWYTGECGLTWWTGGSAAGMKQTVVQDKVTWEKIGSFEEPLLPLNVRPIIEGVLKTAPHPNAALVFINWFLSQEGQTKYVTQEGLEISARRDVTSPVEKIYYSEKPATHYWVVEFDEYLFESYVYALKINFKMMKEGMSKAAWLKAVKDASLAYWGQFPPPPITVLPASQD
ncbi:MAG: extracellular solute-binding protein, partial [Chloroflexi bacterium]|nr:extracellular solute-binding protein [Chloroflexota bacterium]